MPEVITHPNGTALSEDGKYRYLLVRQLIQIGTPLTVTFIMLNPSTADHTVDDPTIRRCKTFALGWGYSKLMVVNLFAYRATDPYSLIHSTEDIVGPRNKAYVAYAMEEADMVIAAWGTNVANSPFLERRARPIIDLIHRSKETFALKITKNGWPVHPLYQPANACPIHFCTRSGA